MTPTATKEALRDRFRSYRSSLSPDKHHQLSQDVAQRVRELAVLKQAETVHVYWPLLERLEIDTRPLIRWLLERHRHVVLPRVVSTDADAEPLMEHVTFTDESELRSNGWGLLEPSSTELVPPDELDVVVVPAFGAGRNGHRVGYGHGFYDAFLHGLDASRLCLTYHATLVNEVPAEPHDVPMTHLVTEQETVHLIPA